MLVCLVGLWARPDVDSGRTLVLLAGIGLFGASFPMVMAHGRAFLPPHLTGRGVSLINLFGIGMAGLMQMATGRLFSALQDDAAGPTAAYQGIFAAYIALVGLGLAIYLLSKDRTD